jgi:hypothetical protein
MHQRKLKTLSILLLAVSFVAGLALPVHGAAMNFGYASIGDSSTSSFGGIYASNFTSPPNIGGITQIRAYLATGGASAQAVIYADENGKPSAFLANSSTITVEATNGSWISFDVSYTGTPNSVYWLGIILNNAATYFYSSRATEQAIYEAPLSDMLNPMPQGNFTHGVELSIAAVYTPVQSSESIGEASWLSTYLVWIIVAGLVVAVILAVAVVMQRKNKPKP